MSNYTSIDIEAIERSARRMRAEQLAKLFSRSKR